MIDFRVSQNDDEKWIKGIKYGIDDNIIAIIVNFS
jgi:hypothetical protein